MVYLTLKAGAIMQNKIFDKIDSLSNTYIQMWEDVCNIESPSNDKNAVDRVGEYFCKLAAMKNWEIEIYEQELFGNVVCITMNAESHNKPIALSGHMDTVHPISSFGTPAVRRDADKLYGPGAMDCKGGIVAGFLAMDALSNCGFKNRPIMMLLQSNEEIGSGLNNKAPINFICQKAKNSIAFLNLEGHEDFFTGKACLIRKGIAGFRFNIQGIETHASYSAREGASAIHEAAYKIIEIEKIKDNDGVTCNCGIITGGTATNTVPGKCEFRVDVRFSTQDQYNNTVSLLQRIADTVYVTGCSCIMNQTNFRPAMELSEKNIALLDKANMLFAQNGLSALEIGMRSGGSDAANVSLCGIPCIDSLGVGGGRAHSVEEFGYISSLSESAKRIASIVYGI